MTTIKRISNLDFIRGISVLGILIMNSLYFALPYSVIFNHPSAGVDGIIDWIAAFSDYYNPFTFIPSKSSSLPFIAISTTSGTGSQCTQAAVVSDTKKNEKIIETGNSELKLTAKQETAVSYTHLTLPTKRIV